MTREPLPWTWGTAWPPCSQGASPKQLSPRAGSCLGPRVQQLPGAAAPAWETTHRSLTTQPTSQAPKSEGPPQGPAPRQAAHHPPPRTTTPARRPHWGLQPHGSPGAVSARGKRAQSRAGPACHGPQNHGARAALPYAPSGIPKFRVLPGKHSQKMFRFLTTYHIA